MIWNREQTSPVDDIIAALQNAKEVTAPPSLATLVDGWRIVSMRFARKPTRERETFSGGVNLSAVARNAQRREEARRVHVNRVTREIFVPDWYLPEFMAGLRRAAVEDAGRK